MWKPNKVVPKSSGNILYFSLWECEHTFQYTNDPGYICPNRYIFVFDTSKLKYSPSKCNVVHTTFEVARVRQGSICPPKRRSTLQILHGE